MLIRELIQASRQLRRTPGYTIVAVATLSLGLASTVTMFTAVNAAFLRALPFPEEGRLVKAYQTNPQRAEIRAPLLVVRDWSRDSREFGALAAYLSRARINVAFDRRASRANLARVTRPFFDAIGVVPTRGRIFNDDETRPGGPPAVVISFRVWQQLLSGRDDVLSQPIEIETEPVPIIGVMPEGFAFPDDTDLWATVDREDPNGYGGRAAHNFDVIGRLRPGVTIDAARAELDTLSLHQQQLDAAMAAEHLTTSVTPLRADLLGPQASLVLIGLGSVLCLLLVCSANVTNLMLARAVSRETEVGIRVALGARWTTVVRATVLESLVLAGSGAVIGLFAGWWGTRLVTSLAPDAITGGERLPIDWRVVALTLAVTTIAGALAAVLPAWRSTRVDPLHALAGGTRGVAATPRRAMNTLVAVEVALAFVLLFGAGLLARSDARLERVDLGFRQHGLVLANVSLGFLKGSPYATAERRRAYFDRVDRAIASSPGVTGVGLASFMPLAFSPSGPLVIAGRTTPAQAHYRLVGGDYFRVMQIPLRRGRLLTNDDDETHPMAAVVNDSLARQVFPGVDPIGQIVTMPNMDGERGLATVVGVVGDVHHQGPAQAPFAEAYFSYRQRPARTFGMTVIVDTALPESDAVALIRSRMQDVDPFVPPEFQTIDARVASVTDAARFRATLLGTLGAATLVLAAVGVLGVVTYRTARRTRELGIRVALGASPWRVMRLVVGGGLAPVASGIAAGVFGAILLGRVLQAFLFEVRPTDGLTLAVSTLTLLAAGAAGSWWPARRAARTAPTAALRQ